MNRSTLRNLILITGLATALSHLYLAFTVEVGKIDFLFALNTIGYLGLVAAFFLNLPFLRGRENLITLAFGAFAGATIFAWVIFGARNFLGYATKLDELLLVIALILYYRLPEESRAS